jgi:uncharacterized membrane protein YeaQ/YmgE (transglycosylase-associated protein family)
MDGHGIIYTLIIGFIAGLLARAIYPGKQKLGIILTIVLGIVGSWVANFIGSTLGCRTDWLSCRCDYRTFCLYFCAKANEKVLIIVLK